MGFFDFLKKKASAEPEREKWSIEELSSKIESLEKNELEEFYNDANTLKKSISSKLSEIKTSCNLLEKAKMARDVDKRVVVRIESAKRNLVSRTNSACDYFSERSKKDVSDLESLNKSIEIITKISGQINSAGSSYADIVSVGFQAEMREFGKLVKDLNNCFKEFFKNSEKNKKKLESINNVKLKIELIKKNALMLQEKDVQIKDIDNGKKELEIQRVEGLQKKQKIESSHAYKSAISSKEKLISLEVQKNKLLNQFRNDFLPLKKPIQKYLYSFGAVLGKNERSKVEEYLNEPLDALSNDNQRVIKDILEKMLELAKKGKIETGSKEKLVLDIEKMLASTIENTATKNSEFEKQIKVIKDDISKSVISEYEDVSDKLNAVEIEERAMIITRETAENERTKINDNLSSIKKQIEEVIVLEFGKDVSIN